MLYFVQFFCHTLCFNFCYTSFQLLAYFVQFLLYNWFPFLLYFVQFWYTLFNFFIYTWFQFLLYFVPFWYTWFNLWHILFNFLFNCLFIFSWFVWQRAKIKIIIIYILILKCLTHVTINKYINPDEAHIHCWGTVHQRIFGISATHGGIHRINRSSGLLQFISSIFGFTARINFLFFSFSSTFSFPPFVVSLQMFCSITVQCYQWNFVKLLGLSPNLKRFDRRLWPIMLRVQFPVGCHYESNHILC